MGRAVRVMGRRGLCHPDVKCGLWCKELGLSLELICIQGVSAGCQEASLRGFLVGHSCAPQQAAAPLLGCSACSKPWRA